MQPGLRVGEVPRFYELDEFTFQNLCCDLYEKEPGIATCEVFGTRGQSQEGIDLLATRSGDIAIDVAQCKCYTSFRPADITKASDDFFKHREYWQGQDIKRFILMVACELSRREQQEELLTQRKRFAEAGIEYQYWSASTIRNKLRPHPGIIQTYFSSSEHWVRVICGATSPPTALPGESVAETSTIVSAALVSQNAQLASLVSGSAERDIERMRAAWREGRKDEAVDGLQKLRADSGLWPVLAPTVRAEALRFEASLEIDTNGPTDRAKQLAREARLLSPSNGDMRLQALMDLKEGNPEAAAAILVSEDDLDSLNLRAAILLEIGRADECRYLLDRTCHAHKPNAETHRISALEHLACKRLEQARLEILKALELQPLWESVRILAAVVNYFSGLSPSALPDRLVSWPGPVDWAFIRRDDQSASRRREAAAVFARLAHAHRSDKEKRQLFETWRVACLATDPELQDEALTYCRSLLEEDPGHFWVIPWVIARRFEVDLRPSEQWLEALVAAGTATIPQVLTLVSCYTASGRLTDAARLLDERRYQFVDARAEDLWTVWKVQTLVAVGDVSEAIEATRGTRTTLEGRIARSCALRAQAEASRDWNPLINHLDSNYVETGDAIFLMEACVTMSQREQWGYVADRAERLAEEVATAESLRLAAFGAFGAERYDLSLSLLDRYRHLFRQQILPGELRSLRVHCQRARGALRGAIADAEALANEEPTTENLLNLAQLRYEMGDLKGLTMVARDLLGQPDLPVPQMLAIAQWVLLEDRALAASLWRRAMREGIPDEVLATAMELAFQLGLERESSPLLGRSIELAATGESGIRHLNTEEFVEYLQHRQERVAQLAKAYEAGAAPIHLIAGEAGSSLADLYHARLEENERSADPRGRPFLLIRHGGHGLPPGFPSTVPAWRLHMDLTAVLLAAHLCILPEVESVFRPVRIPAELIPALLEMCQDLSRHQLVQIKARHRIVELVDRGSILVVHCPPFTESSDSSPTTELGQEWAALHEAARREEGYVVDFLPARGDDLLGSPPVLPEDVLGRLVNCRAVVDALRRHGQLTEAEHTSAVIAMGDEGRNTTSLVVPALRAPLYAHRGVLEVLAAADLIDLVCLWFRVRIEDRELERVREELRIHDRLQQTAQWVNRLIDSLRVGISNGTYELLPPSSRVETAEADLTGRADSNCLSGLLQFETQPGDVIWFDDRFLNGFLHRGAAQIIGVSEILRALVGAGVLDTNSYFAKVTTLRSANLGFIPVEKDEILYHVRQAKLEKGQLLETGPLATLRRYVAMCLVNGSLLQRPVSPANGRSVLDEARFVLDLTRTINESIVEVWSSPTEDEELRQARADWVLSNLYLTHFDIANITSLRRPEHDSRQMTALGLAGLLTSGSELDDGRDGDGESTRQRYMMWLLNRVLDARFRADPDLIPIVAEYVKSTISDVLARASRRSERRSTIRFMQLFIDDLPHGLRAELMADPAFMSALSLESRTAATAFGLQFDPEDFWRAVIEAVNGREGTAVAFGEAQVITFRPFSDPDRPTVQLVRPEKGVIGNIIADEFAVLLESPTQREAALHRHRYWFDCPTEAFHRVAAEIVTLEPPRARIDALADWQSRSAAAFYDALAQKLHGDRRTELSELTPHDANILLAYLRIDADVSEGTEFHSALAAAAERLIQDLGPEEAIQRLVGLPVSLPEVILSAVRGMSRQGARAAIKRLRKDARSPLCRIHLIRILIRVGDPASAYRRLARRLVRWLFRSEALEEMAAFIALLRWVDGNFILRSEVRTWSSAARLTAVWAHAHKLFTIFVSSGAPMIWIRETFSNREEPLAAKTFERDSVGWFDIAVPRRVRPTVLLLAGVSYGCGEEMERCIDRRCREPFEACFPAFTPEAREMLQPLLSDPARAQNSLGSFLGDDRSVILLALLGAERAVVFASSSLKASTERAVALLREKRDDLEAWVRLCAMLGDLPPDDEVRGRLESLMCGTDFVGLLERDAAIGALGLNTASLQVVHLDSELLREHLEDQVVKIAKSAARRASIVVESPTSPDSQAAWKRMDVTLIECAFNISRAGGHPSREVVVEFAELSGHILDAWPATAPTMRRIFQRLYDELPISHAHRLSPFLVRLRAC